MKFFLIKKFVYLKKVSLIKRKLKQNNKQKVNNMITVRNNVAEYFKMIEETAPQEKRKSFAIENAFRPIPKDGKFEVVIRFLPPAVTEFKPFVENRSHLFKIGEDKWFVCDCLEKFGKPCPICDFNRGLYKTHTKEEAYKLRLGNARSKYISNILVVKNDAAPDTEGKVFRFEYGRLIMEKIRTAMTGYDDPDEGHIEGFNPFDYNTGANFIYSGVQGAYGPKLDGSHFSKQKPISDKANVPYTQEQVNALEAKLYTLDDCEHKESECRDYESIVKAYKDKTGKDLFEGTSSPAADAIKEDVPVAPVSVKPVSVSTPVKPAKEENEVLDSNDFFAALENS